MNSSLSRVTEKKLKYKTYFKQLTYLSHKVKGLKNVNPSVAELQPEPVASAIGQKVKPFDP